MKVFVVTGSWQDYETSGYWMVKGFKSYAEAEAYAKLLQQDHSVRNAEFQYDMGELSQKQRSYRGTQSLLKVIKDPAYLAISKFYNDKWDKPGLDPDNSLGENTVYTIDELEIVE